MANDNLVQAKNNLRRTLSGKDDRPKFNQKPKKSEEEKDFDAFLMVLNAANRTAEKAPYHYDAFIRDGFAYFDEHPEILNATPMKFNKTIEQAKQRLHATLKKKSKK